MDYNPKLVKFLSEDKIFLPGLLFTPEKKTDQVALYLHGNGSSSVFYSTDRTNNLASALNKKGIAYFTFNNRGAHYIKKLTKIVNNEEEDVRLGMAYELIKDCLLDIDGAIKMLEGEGYKTFYLIGLSTGANKICVYNFYKPQNKISKYILLSGGDDTGLYYQEVGRKKFFFALKKCQEEIKKGNGNKLVGHRLVYDLISYQSLYDTINPDGDYNTFPFNEYINNLGLSQKPLFWQFKKITKPTLVVYGERDEYCYGDVPKCVDILMREVSYPDKFTFKIIPGADHGFTCQEEELARIITQWLA